MSEAVAALNRRDFEVARAGFERARAIKPDAPGIASSAGKFPCMSDSAAIRMCQKIPLGRSMTAISIFSFLNSETDNRSRLPLIQPVQPSVSSVLITTRLGP